VTAGLLALVALGSATGGFVNGISGFAFSMVAMSVWAWSLDPRLIAPMVVFGALVAQLLSLTQVWRASHWRLLVPFLIGGVIGVPLGVALLSAIDARLFRLLAGIVLVAYSSLLLLVRRPRPVTRGGAPADAAVGFVGGVMGGLAGLTGPVPVLWCSLRGWDRDTQRGVFQGYSTTMLGLTLVVYFARGTLGADELRIFALMMPAILLPAWAGVRLYRRINDVQFRRLVLVLLALSGAALILGAALAS
jgi:uncharacterized membrane protein YfcA